MPSAKEKKPATKAEADDKKKEKDAAAKEAKEAKAAAAAEKKAAAAEAKAAKKAEADAKKKAFDQGGPQQAMGVAPEAIPMGTPVAMQRRGSWLGFSGFAATAGASSSSSTQPTLLEMTEILKRELGLKGNMTDVVKQAAEQLNVDVRLPLMEMAKQCVQKLGVRQRL